MAKSTRSRTSRCLQKHTSLRSPDARCRTRPALPAQTTRILDLSRRKSFTDNRHASSCPISHSPRPATGCSSTAPKAVAATCPRRSSCHELSLLWCPVRCRETSEASAGKRENEVAVHIADRAQGGVAEHGSDVLTMEQSPFEDMQETGSFMSSRKGSSSSTRWGIASGDRCSPSTCPTPPRKQAEDALAEPRSFADAHLAADSRPERRLPLPRGSRPAGGWPVQRAVAECGVAACVRAHLVHGGHGLAAERVGQ